MVSLLLQMWVSVPTKKWKLIIARVNFLCVFSLFLYLLCLNVIRSRVLSFFLRRLLRIWVAWLDLLFINGVCMGRILKYLESL